VAGTGGGSITVSGSIQLSNTAFNLLPGASYTVTITANYTTLVNGAGVLEPQSITTSVPCVVTINGGPSMAVRSTQWCSTPTTLLRSSYLRADPFACGATSYTFRFTPAQDCAGTIAGASFERTSINRVLQLNFNGSTTVPSGMTISNQTYYNVEVRANHGPGGSVLGTYGPVRTIFVGGTNSEEYSSADETLLAPLTLSALDIYPNPSFDQSIVLQTENFQDELVEIAVYDQTGRLSQKDQVLVEQGLYYDFNTDRSMSAGMYIVELKSPSTLLRGQFIIQK
jgi:hypothetical protein